MIIGRQWPSVLKVTIIAYDKTRGTRDQRDFDVEVCLPSGKPYRHAREQKSTEPKVRDKARRISC